MKNINYCYEYIVSGHLQIHKKWNYNIEIHFKNQEDDRMVCYHYYERKR